MEHLETPSEETWNERRTWFESQIFSYEESGTYLLSEQACALLAEVQSCYCAGAWVAVLILAHTVIETQLLETEMPGFKGNSKELLQQLGFEQEYQELRIRRNRMVHLRPDQPAITVDQQWGNREELHEEAKRAVVLMFEAFFSNPGT